MLWEDFRDRLQASLPELTDRCFLIVSAPPGQGYVQFAAMPEAVTAEAAGPEFVTSAPATTAGDPRMLGAGWAAPDSSRPNWSYDLPLPALTDEYRALADRCVVALRDVYRVGDPGVLTYQAWREPEPKPFGSFLRGGDKDLDPGANPLPLPGLGLRPQPVG